MLKFKPQIESLNYYAWAKFLKQINEEYTLVKVIDKLELSTPRREDLSVYRELLRKEFEENTCFYCGKKLSRKIHVDHFVPWSFVKSDKLWNFVLACPECNMKKSNQLPQKEYLIKIENRNRQLIQMKNIIVEDEFKDYSEQLFERIWTYAKQSGIREYKIS